MRSDILGPHSGKDLIAGGRYEVGSEGAGYSAGYDRADYDPAYHS
jgi:hypothetical protein